MEKKVILLFVQGCHAYHQAFDELATTLKEAGLPTRFEALLITSDEEAEKHKFFGSPAVQVDGVDVDPRAEAVTKYGMASCRPYPWQGKSYDFPPKEMILKALKK